MTQFWNRIAIWSSLHEPVLIYGSSHGSVFKSPLYRVHNEHESKSGPGLLQLVRISPNRFRIAATRNRTHELTRTYTHTPYTYTYTRAYVHVYPHIHTYTSIHINTHYLNIYTHTYLQILAHTYMPIPKHAHHSTHTNSCIY